MKDIFTQIYHTNIWHSDESVSGTGSTMKETESIRHELPLLLKEFSIKSILDIPCGDFNWMKTVDLTGINYIGADIVEEIVERNNEKYKKDNVSFCCMDITKDDLPQKDLVIVRDCMVHFSYADISLALKNIVKSNPKYVLTTSFVNRGENVDITTGAWRPLNLMANPFNIKPVKIITEHCPQDEWAFMDKSLILIAMGKQ